ncbi:MAG TPA: GYF domain-containing protein [Pirellulaceae bacterium]|nr:GYF domain-containing protein [Pirellulaceae bacterium]
MKAEWLANVDGQEYGPYTWQQMLQMAAEGRVPADLPVKRVQDKKWYKAAQVPGLLAPAKTASAAATPVASAKKKDDSSHFKRARPLQATASAAPPAVQPPPPPGHAAEPPRMAAGHSAGGDGFPVIIAAAPRKSASHAAMGEPADHVPRRKSLLVVGIASGIAAVVLLGGGAIAWIAWTRDSTTINPAKVAAAKQPITEATNLGPAEPAAESSAESHEVETKDESSPTKAELTAQEKTVRSIARWNSLAVSHSATISNATIRVTRVWRADAPADDQAKTPEKKFVCVEVAIANKSRSPLKYRGWNSYGENGAILADESKKVLPLVPVAKTPGMSRLAAGSVPGNSSITEVLVFEAPVSEEEVLHLVLPYGVFYANVKPSPYRALELTPDIFGADLAAAQAPARANETEENLRDAIAGASADNGNPPAAPGSDAARTAPGEPKSAEKGKDKPPSLRDIINNDPTPPAKADDPPAAKGGKDTKEKGKPPEPAKKPENPFEPKDAEKPPAAK